MLYDEDAELEAQARHLLRRSMKRTRWYYRTVDWLKAVKHCFGWAIKEFRECYRERND